MSQPTLMHTHQAAAFYLSLGFAPLPLPAGTKQIAIRDWQRRDPADLWDEVPSDANLALRCGGARHLAVIDCDDRTTPGTSQRVTSFLGSLGIHTGSYPVIRSASGGQHLYLRLSDPAEGSIRRLSPEMGAGELRYGPGAYVVAPPSQVGGSPYQLLAGDFAAIPCVDWLDLAPLLPVRVAGEARPVSQGLIPYQSHANGVPKRVLAMLAGHGRDRYPSGSEYDQAILTIWLNHNPDTTFDEVLREFAMRARYGRYHDLRLGSEASARDYLHRSFVKAAEFTCKDSSIRLDLHAWICRTEDECWEGIVGLRQKAIYLAHLSIAHAAGRLDYSASVRQLSLASGQTTDLVVRVTQDLIQSGNLSLVRRGRAIHPNRYAVLITPSTLTHSRGIVPSVESPRYLDLLQENLFAPSALGLSAVEIYWRLLSHRRTKTELALLTALSMGTVRRALEKLASLEAPHRQTGELLPLIWRDGSQWVAQGDLDLSYALMQLQRRAEAAKPGRRPVQITDRRERMAGRYARESQAFRREAARRRKPSSGRP